MHLVTLTLFFLCFPTLVPGATAAREYDLRGQVIDVDPAKKSVVIHHDEIPDFMMEMTMPFDVKDAKVLDGITTNDLVRGRLAVTEDAAWLTTLSVTGKGTPRPPRSKPAFLQQAEQVEEGAGVKLLEPGDAVPDFTFVDQTGTTKSLSGLRGRAVALTFIYTRCPLPNFCPAISKNFNRVQEIVKREAATDKVHLVTVSFDPEYDTPKVMLAYGREQKADFQMWSFVTSTPRAIHDSAANFGLVYSGSGVDINHNMRSVIIAPDGKFVEMVTGSDWDAAEFAKKLVSAAEKK